MLPVLPELVLAVGAMVLLMLGAYRGAGDDQARHRACGVLLVVTGALELMLPAGKLTTFGGSFIVDDFARFLKILALIGSAATLILSTEFLSDPSRRIFEYSILVLLSTLGMMVLISAGDLIMLYLGLELMRLALYVVAASFIVDDFARFLKILAIIGSAVTLILSTEFLSDPSRRIFEYSILVLLSTLGMMVLISAGDLIMLYLGLELMSLALYVVAATNRDNAKSTEAGLKYFVLGALSSGMLLYGASLIYGFTGTVEFAGIAAAVKTGSIGIVFGLVFLLAGLCFKVSAVPFHMWTPDVYEGAPTPVTAFFASAPKVAALAVFTRVALTAFPGIVPQWQQIVVFVAIASMALGSFAAIGQKNIKRLMAYSSIGHMGFALVGLAAGTVEGAQGVLVYIAIYVAMTLGTFAVILAMKRNGQPMEQISDFAGLSRTNPLLAFFFAMLLFSLAGIPPLAGFFAKWYVFVAAIKAGLFTLAVIGVLTSVVGAFYYLTIIKVMYFDEPAGEIDPMRIELRTVLAVAGLFNIFFFVYPGPLVSVATAAAKSLFLEWHLRARSPRPYRRATGLAAFDQIGSTNAEAMARARDGERGPMWFVTTEQTAGRGRRQRAWIAPRGNLASSVLEVMDVSPAVAATLGFAAGLGARERAAEGQHRGQSAVGRIGSVEISPEMAERRSGPRAEARRHPAGGRGRGRRSAWPSWSGIGTNVVAAPEGTPTPATSLAALGVHVGAEELFAALSDAWVEFRGIWDNGRGFGEIRRLWLERAAGLGEPVAIQTGTATVRRHIRHHR